MLLIPNSTLKTFKHQIKKLKKILDIKENFKASKLRLSEVQVIRINI